LSPGRLLGAAGLVAALALLIYGLTTQGADESIDEALAAGSAPPAPAFGLEVIDRGEIPRKLATRVAPALSDERLDLAELRGTPLVLNFWASWCVPCREEAPILERGWHTARDDGVLFIGLNMQDLTGDAADFIEEYSISYPTIRDPGKDVSIDYGLTGIPETMFIDARQRIVAHAIGVLSAEQLRAGVGAAASGEVIGILSGGALGGRG
jgi:cytochrome c biogenesis protein CcmG/thiol:disulfide interchange protein DsbE